MKGAWPGIIIMSSWKRKGAGHYIGCNLSVTNFKDTWWGEGDDMIWVDGYKWPPDLHGTGSEDYFGQAWGMQPNAFLRNGSSIFEGGTIPSQRSSCGAVTAATIPAMSFTWKTRCDFTQEIKVTIEHGHANHLANEMSSVAYWYAGQPAPAVEVPPVAQRLPVRRDNAGQWLKDPERECPGKPVELNDEMRAMKEQWALKIGMTEGEAWNELTPRPLDYRARFEPLDAAMQAYVERGQVAGMMTVLVRAAKCGAPGTARARRWILAGWKTGRRGYHLPHFLHDQAGHLLAVLMLHEQGHFDLETPITEFMPELRSLQVLAISRDGSWSWLTWSARSPSLIC
jgi:hypothetical protein